MSRLQFRTILREAGRAPEVAWRREATAGIRLQGDVRIGDAISNPYFVELTVRLVPRTVDYPHGIEILDIRDI